jgi:hypothetical protein
MANAPTPSAQGQTQNQSQPTSGFAIANLAGRFAFRFGGFPVRNGIMYRLDGVGQFTLDAQGNLTGKQRSAITALQGQSAKLDTGAFALTGTVTLDSDGTGSASIKFRATDGGTGDVDGEFFLAVAGSPDRLWLISSGGTEPSSGDQADELCSLEAVRMPTS